MPLELAPIDHDFTKVPRYSDAESPFPRRKTEWTRESCIEGMAKAIVLYVPAGQHLTQDVLKEIAKAHPREGIPSYSIVHRRAPKVGETFEDWRREAYKLAKKVKPAALAG